MSTALASAAVICSIIVTGNVGAVSAAASTLYEHAEYRGKTFAAVSAKAIGNGLDRRASAIRNHNRTTTIFKATGYRGDSWTIRYDYNRLNSRWNDAIRSFRRL